MSELARIQKEYEVRMKELVLELENKTKVLRESCTHAEIVDMFMISSGPRRGEGPKKFAWKGCNRCGKSMSQLIEVVEK